MREVENVGVEEVETVEAVEAALFPTLSPVLDRPVRLYAMLLTLCGRHDRKTTR